MFIVYVMYIEYVHYSYLNFVHFNDIKIRITYNSRSQIKFKTRISCMKIFISLLSHVFTK